MMLIGAAEPPRARRRGDLVRGSLLQLLATAPGPSRQAAFFGPTADNGALLTWLDLQLAQPNVD